MFSDNYAIKLEINSKRSKNIHVSDRSNKDMHERPWAIPRLKQASLDWKTGRGAGRVEGIQ